VIPAYCVLDLGVRLLPGMSADEMTGRVRAVVQAAVSRVSFELAVLGETPPMIAAEDAPIIRLLAGELGQSGSGSAPFGTDGGWLTRLGLDCVICGPGSIEVAHKPNESLPVAEFVHAGELLTRVVHRACAAGPA
jgi:acetylornithine deacetylase